MKKHLNYPSIPIDRGAIGQFLCRSRIFLFTFLAVIGFLSTGFSQIYRFNFHYPEVSVIKVFEEVKKQSDYEFFYSNRDVNEDRMVKLDVETNKVEDVMDRLLTDTKLTYKIKDNLVVITQGAGKLSNSPVQDGKVTGRVTDKKGTPIPGVTIIVKGTVTGVTTGIDGDYSLSIPKGKSVLQFSFVGMKTQEIVIGEQSVINVLLEDDTENLEEVVVVGYGTQTRSQMSTSVSKLNTKVLESSSRSNAATALQGTIAGLRVTNKSGQPGSTPSIVLRGGTSWDGSGSPLILIDGVPGSFYALNADDIESMEVLKDAASSAIYGARAADGVILITTKKGKPGKSNINYKLRYSINKERNDTEYANAADFIKYNRQGILYYNEVTGKTNFDASLLDGPMAFGIGNNTTDSPFTPQYLTDENSYLLKQPGWGTLVDPVDPTKKILFYDNKVSDLIYQDSYAADHYLSVDGGNDKGTYYLGLGYLNNNGLILGSKFERFSSKFSGSYKVLENLKVYSTVSYSHSSIYGSPLGADDKVFRRFQGQPATSRTYNTNPDGTLSSDLAPGTNSGFGNPLYYKDKFVKKNLEQRLSLSAGMDWDIMNDLKLTLKGSFFTINSHNSSFNKAYISGGSYNTSRKAYARLDRTIRNQYTALLTYNKTIAENHNFKALVGAEYYKNNYFRFSAGTKGSPSDLIHTLNAGSEANGVPYSVEEDEVIVSTFGQLTYDFDMKYLLGLTVRRDGSSRLGNEKYAIFPGVSAGWNVHNENLFKESFVSKYISKLKPRISYGVNGKVSSLGLYQVYGSYGDQGVYGGQTGYANTGLPTLDLVWEKSTTLNFGLDIGLLNNRVSVAADYFIRDVKDKIANLTLPYWTGFGAIKTNNGTLRNKGLELQVSADVIKKKDLKWTLGTTLYTVKNYVVDLPENDNENNRQGGTEIYDPSTGGVKWVGGYQEGKRVGADLIVAYVQDYIYADQAAVDEHSDRVDKLANNQTTRFPGDVAWKDLNDDGIIDYKDRKVIGRSTPDFMGGFTSNLTWKNFNLFVKTDFSLGHLIRNNLREKGLAQTQGNINAYEELTDSWTPENRNTDVPRMVFVDPQKNYIRGSSRMWEKGDYLAIREVSLSYVLPKSALKGKLAGLRVFFSGENLHYFKSYSGDTPELGGFRHGDFPMPRTYTFGINATL